VDVSAWLAVQFMLSFIALAIGAYYDFKTREVSNWIWAYYGGLAFVIAVLEYGVSILLGIHLLFAGLISGPLFLLWYKYEDLLGGADLKAIMCLSLSLSFLGFMVIAYAALLVGVYVAYRAFQKKVTFKESLRVKAPYIPFLFVGLELTIIFWILAPTAGVPPPSIVPLLT